MALAYNEPRQDYREALDFTNAKEHPLALYGFTDDEALKKRSESLPCHRHSAWLTSPVIMSPPKYDVGSRPLQ